MKLLFLYDANTRKAYNFVQGFSFHIRAHCLLVELSEPLSDRFFSLDDLQQKAKIKNRRREHLSRVESISAIIGKNGSGKTMTARLMGRLFGEFPPYRGWMEIVADGTEVILYGKNDIDIFEAKNNLERHGFLVVDKRGKKVVECPYECIYYTPFCADHKVWSDEQGHYYELSPAAYFDQPDCKISKVVIPSPQSVEIQTTPLKKYSHLMQEEVIEFVADYYANGLDGIAHGSFPIPSYASISDDRFQTVEMISAREDARNDVSVAGSAYKDLFLFAAGELNVQAMCCAILKAAVMLIDKKLSKLDYSEIKKSKFLKFLKALCEFGKLVRAADREKGRAGELGMIWHRVLKKDQRSECYEIITNALELMASEKEACQIVKWDQLNIIWKALVKIDEKYEGDFDDDMMLCSFKDHESYSNFVNMMLAHSKMELEKPFINVSIANVSSGEMSYLMMFSRLHSVMKKLGYSRVKEVSNKRPLNVVLFMDEAETTMHPEWQRQLVSNIIWYFEGFTSNVRAHVIFASHSPMLLSDLPIDNVIFLDNEYEKSGMRNTFGANIFELYRLAFNQANGPMGAFAKRKIDKALKKVAELVTAKHLNYGTNNVDEDPLELDDETEATLKLIGDPLIDRYLKSLHEGGLL